MALASAITPNEQC